LKRSSYHAKLRFWSISGYEKAWFTSCSRLSVLLTRTRTCEVPAVPAAEAHTLGVTPGPFHGGGLGIA